MIHTEQLLLSAQEHWQSSFHQLASAIHLTAYLRYILKYITCQHWISKQHLVQNNNNILCEKTWYSKIHKQMTPTKHSGEYMQLYMAKA